MAAAVAAVAGEPGLDLPPRPAAALGGQALAAAVSALPLAERERRLEEEFLSGNVPSFLRRLCPVQMTLERDAEAPSVTVFVTPDYLATGSDEDFLRWPMTPGLAQRLADRLRCLLPTPRMVDAIYAAAPLKLAPEPIAPSAAMTSVAVFLEHHAMVERQRRRVGASVPLGVLTAGHKKDVVICQRLAAVSDRVAIYGWHRPDGTPIQPLYVGHRASWVDYSHGVRLVAGTALMRGHPAPLVDLLRDPGTTVALSDEGPLALPQVRYEAPPSRRSGVPVPDPGREQPERPATTRPGWPTAEPDGVGATPGATGTTATATAPGADGLLPGFAPAPAFGEQVCQFSLEPEVTVQIVAPVPLAPTGAPVELVLYALPNGNTIDQTCGRQTKPGEDWHYDIQHIGAQARFVRARAPERQLVVAYLEAEGRSWPTWRRRHAGAARTIPDLVAAVRQRLGDPPAHITLNGHSGGGSFVFGYLDAVESIPAEVGRIAFLDSTYNYDPAKGHAAKLAAWLQGDPQRALCVIAYEDSVALLNGKPVVSATGGTWYRSQRLQEDLAQSIPFTAASDDEALRFGALEGRVQMILWRNPKRAILHTVLVERNGFIHSLLSGTAAEGQGYVLFGPRAYSDSIAPAPD